MQKFNLCCLPMNCREMQISSFVTDAVDLRSLHPSLCMFAQHRQFEFLSVCKYCTLGSVFVDFDHHQEQFSQLSWSTQRLSFITTAAPLCSSARSVLHRKNKTSRSRRRIKWMIQTPLVCDMICLELQNKKEPKWNELNIFSQSVSCRNKCNSFKTSEFRRTICCS